MDRRSFVLNLGGFAAVATLAPSLVACKTEETDSDSETETETDTDTDTDTEDTATGCADCADSAAEGPSDSHGHLVCLSQAQVDGGDVTITSQDGSHDHSVAITAAELTTLRDTGTVTVTSNDIHEHTWVITICAA